MPEGPLTPDKRTLQVDPADIAPPERAPFVELGLVSCFSFLRGASDAVDLVLAAHALGYDALGIADVNSMAGVVRIHTEAKTLKLRSVIGCRIETVEGLAFLSYPEDRTAYGRLCRLISAGRMQTLSGEWQDKGVCEIDFGLLAEHSEGVQLILLPPDDLEAELTIVVPSNVVPLPLAGGVRGGSERGELGDGPTPSPSRKREGSYIPRSFGPTSFTAPFSDLLPHLVRQFPTLKHIAASYLYRGDDIARIERLDSLARTPRASGRDDRDPAQDHRRGGRAPAPPQCRAASQVPCADAAPLRPLAPRDPRRARGGGPLQFQPRRIAL